ncbi:MAG: hypothetical protein AAB524_02205 [Patescibacteria group bacterium]
MAAVFIGLMSRGLSPDLMQDVLPIATLGTVVVGLGLVAAIVFGALVVPVVLAWINRPAIPVPTTVVNIHFHFEEVEEPAGDLVEEDEDLQVYTASSTDGVVKEPVEAFVD